LETSIKVGLQPEGAHNRQSKTVMFWKKTYNFNSFLAIVVAKFATQWLFDFHFAEILLVTLN